MMREIMEAWSRRRCPGRLPVLGAATVAKYPFFRRSRLTNVHQTSDRKLHGAAFPKATAC